MSNEIPGEIIIIKDPVHGEIRIVKDPDCKEITPRAKKRLSKQRAKLRVALNKIYYRVFCEEIAKRKR